MVKFKDFVVKNCSDPDVVSLKRQNLLMTAEQAFIASGYHGTTLRSVATLGNVSGAMINYYFRSKEELYLAVLHTIMSRLRKTFNAVFASDAAPHVRLETLIDLLVDTAGAESGAIYLIMEEINVRYMPDTQWSSHYFTIDFRAHVLTILSDRTNNGPHNPPTDAVQLLASLLNLHTVRALMLNLPIQFTEPAHGKEGLDKYIKVFLKELVENYIKGTHCTDQDNYER